jgi:hypothetical protein
MGRVSKIGFEVRKCARAHVPSFKGNAELETLISPEGTFDALSFKQEQWEKNSQASTCVKQFLTTQRVSERGDGHSNTWTFTFEIR